jgi:tetratricopeptide (TPR) repeat protein/RNA polymerase subunit RPABC4/transcription elongation factor Spt4
VDYAAQAAEAYNDDRYEDTVELYTKAIAEDGGSAVLYYNRALASDCLKDYESSFADYRKAAELDPDDEDYKGALAGAYNRKGVEAETNEKAIELYSKALELDPNRPTIYHNRGNTWRKLEEYEKALADYTAALGLEESWNHHYSRGVCYEKLGDNESALAAYTKAAETRPQDTVIRNNRARVNMALGRYEDALEDLEAALSKEALADDSVGRGSYWVEAYEEAKTNIIAVKKKLATPTVVEPKPVVEPVETTTPAAKPGVSTLRQAQGGASSTAGAPATIPCPSCGASIAAGSKFCPECGTKIPENPTAKFCGNCGVKLPPGVKFCPECGAKAG